MKILIIFMTGDLYTIREMAERDLDEVSTLSEDCGFFTWRKEDYQRELSKPESVILIAGRENKNHRQGIEIDGFIFARLITPEAELLNLAVREKCRRAGVGTLLFEKFIEKCLAKKIENLWLEVRASNVSAINFYLNKGFIRAGKRLSYYSNPVEDAILMSLKCFPLKDDA